MNSSGQSSMFPYVGLRTFDSLDRGLFSGRSREIRSIVDLIYVNPILILYSQSGAGKTSLLRAGVIPKLKEDGFEILPLGRIGVPIPHMIEPEKIKNIFVFSYLFSNLEEGTDPTTLATQTLTTYLKGLERHLDEIRQPSPRLLIFDQFEELFITHQDRWNDRQDFFEQVYRALDSDHLLRVVFAIREEYIGEMDRYTQSLHDQRLARFHLERLRAADAVKAASDPLRITGQHFADGVAEKIVSNLTKIRVPTAEGHDKEVLGEFVEPAQLQIVLYQLWKALPLGVIEITEEYISAKGPDAALSDFYDNCIKRIANLSGLSEETFRSWFEKSLITPAGTRNLVIRGEKETAGIPNYAVDQLQNLHLIKAENRHGVILYELAHDRLIQPIQESNKRFYQYSKP